MVTIRDVASKAEVSIATVSRVVNSNRPVHPDIFSPHLGLGMGVPLPLDFSNELR